MARRCQAGGRAKALSPSAATVETPRGEPRGASPPKDRPPCIGNVLECAVVGLQVFQVAEGRRLRGDAPRGSPRGVSTVAGSGIETSTRSSNAPSYTFPTGSAAFSSLRGLVVPGITPSPMRLRAVTCEE